MSSNDPVREALESARNTLAFSSQDWSLSKDFAWLYGLLCGWDADAMAEVAAKFDWPPSEVARLQRLRAALEGASQPAPTGVRESEETRRYRLALEGLTPGGSEFVKDPEACVRFVRERREAQKRAAFNAVKRQRDAELFRKSLRMELRHHFGELAGENTGGMWEEFWLIRQAAAALTPPTGIREAQEIAERLTDQMVYDVGSDEVDIGTAALRLKNGIRAALESASPEPTARDWYDEDGEPLVGKGHCACCNHWVKQVGQMMGVDESTPTQEPTEEGGD